MLNLPSVSLVLADTHCQQMARLALDDCLRAAEFAHVIVATNQPELFADVDALLVPVLSGWANKDEREQFIWYELTEYVDTSHWLRLQWDGWIVDPGRWSNCFLDYDYVGAPWLWHEDNYKVGNGGFALHSKRLADFLRDNRERFPLFNPSDHLICRTYREVLADHGFTWAPLHVAERFAFECGPDGRDWDQPPSAFGMHGIWNFKHVLTAEQLLERARYATPYALEKAKQWGGQEFVDCFTKHRE